MTTGVMTVSYQVTDLAAAKQLHGELIGAKPYMDEPYYLGFNVEGKDVGLDPNGHGKGMAGPIAIVLRSSAFITTAENAK